MHTCLYMYYLMLLITSVHIALCQEPCTLGICSHQPSWIKHWAAFIKYIRKAKRLWLAANYKLQNINKTQTSIFARSHLRTVQIWLAILFYFIKFCLKVFVYRHSCVFGSDFNCLYFAVIYSLSVCNLVKHSLYSLQKFVSCLKAAKLLVSSLLISKEIQTHLRNLLGHKIVLVYKFLKC